VQGVANDQKYLYKTVKGQQKNQSKICEGGRSLNMAAITGKYLVFKIKKQ